ncbi:MAG: PLP-dependent aminotransferase family protein [Chloroflexi bacterium]|nr:PLP-dependent aminotransferase family protein [Chloroflexota bacterium]
MGSSTLNITLDRDSATPIYRQLIAQIRSLIESGELPAGARLPASRSLARQQGISRISVVNAYRELRGAGLLHSHAGKGTFVARQRSASAILRSPLPEPSQRAPALRHMLRKDREGIIDFSGGTPPTEFFPVRYLQDAINQVIDRDGAEALSYEAAEGYLPLRSAVRDYVQAIGIRCRYQDVLITGGAQQAIDLVLQSLMQPGETLLTADPTYLGIIDIAQARRVRIHGLPVDDQGIRIDALEQACRDLQPRLIYVMPSYQNPTGHLMPLHRRRQLVRLAARLRIPVLEDEVYREFRFDGEALPPLKALDESGVVIHTNAFTKVLLPGVRIGYLVADGAWHERLARVKQAADISTSGLNQRAIHLLLERGVLGKQLERNRLELLRRRGVALAAAQRHFPAGARWVSPRGGLYLWVELPGGRTQRSRHLGSGAGARSGFCAGRAILDAWQTSACAAAELWRTSTGIN